MKYRARKYHDGRDEESIREFFRIVYLRNERQEYSWSLYRWDYWRWHINKNLFHFNLEAAVFLWESRNDHLAAVLNPDHPGEACLQVHPDHRSLELEVAMISTAETQYAVTQPDGRQSLKIWSATKDILRQEILIRRGYAQSSELEYQQRLRLDRQIRISAPPEGYTIRPLGGLDELPARSWLSWKVFHPNEPDERYDGWEWYCNVQSAPLYRHDLDLVAVAPTGELAAFCTVWYDEMTCTASFEPVGTHPAHQRRGLGKAVMAEGLRIAQLLGATLATVDSYSEQAKALYTSMGFTDIDLCQAWVKIW